MNITSLAIAHVGRRPIGPPSSCLKSFPPNVYRWVLKKEYDADPIEEDGDSNDEHENDDERPMVFPRERFFRPGPL